MGERLDWLISVDDHIIEPPELWQVRVPHKYRDRAPRVERIEGYDTWLYEDLRTHVPGNMVCADKEPGDFSPLPVNYEDMRPGYYDSASRVADMNVDGVLAAACFPTFPRFCGQVFTEAKDKDLALVCLQVYNDWIIDEWAGAAPGRFIPLIVLLMFVAAVTWRLSHPPDTVIRSKMAGKIGRASCRERVCHNV